MLSRCVRSLPTALLLALTLSLAACGFHLRGAYELPYRQFHIAVPPETDLGAELRRQIRAHQPEILVERSQGADGVFREIGHQRDRIIAALSAEGRAREYQLRLTYTFRVEDAKGEALTPVQEIVLTREITYDDNQLLSKDQEEGFLWAEMNRDLASQIVRRLTHLQPRPLDNAGGATAGSE